MKTWWIELVSIVSVCFGFIAVAETTRASPSYWLAWRAALVIIGVSVGPWLALHGFAANPRSSIRRFACEKVLPIDRGLLTFITAIRCERVFPFSVAFYFSMVALAVAHDLSVPMSPLYLRRGPSSTIAEALTGGSSDEIHKSIAQMRLTSVVHAMVAMTVGDLLRGKHAPAS